MKSQNILKVPFFLFLLSSITLIISCNKNTNEDPLNSNDSFKTNMLISYADSIIMPTYKNFQNNLITFEQEVNQFIQNPSIENQEALIIPFRDLYVSFEGISLPYFGPSASILLNNYINTFPADTSKIENHIFINEFDFYKPTASDNIQGLPALDYLLFEPQAIENFSIANSNVRKQYVLNIILHMKLLAQNCINQWEDGYRITFISSLKTNVGSSIGSIINQLSYEMDALKGPRIGWPFGKQSNGIVFADKCEGYFSGNSLDLALANLASIKKYYSGTSHTGIDDYLILLGKKDLNLEVLNQFNTTISALENIPKPLSASFSSHASQVEKTYKEIQKLLTLIKTDVASATAVQITYMDNDGD